MPWLSGWVSSTGCSGCGQHRQSPLLPLTAFLAGSSVWRDCVLAVAHAVVSCPSPVSSHWVFLGRAPELLLVCVQSHVRAAS